MATVSVKRSIGICGGRKNSEPKKNPWSKDQNEQQTQPTYDTGVGLNQGWATLVGGKRSHHCAIPAPLINSPV